MTTVIDGHNLIGKIPGLSLKDPDDEAKLIRRLHRFAQRTGKPITVVFDPGAIYTPPQKQAFRDVKVIYAPQGSTADRVIATLVKKARNPREITVVTSDHALAGLVKASGAQVMHAEEFVQRMEPPAPEIEPDIAEEEERAGIRLSKDEVNAWMAEFAHARQQRRHRKTVRR